MNGFYMRSVIFRDDVPLLEYVNFGYDEVSIMGHTNSIKMRSHVNWENMKHLAFFYSNSWENITSQLKLVETLHITQEIDEPCIMWSNLVNLTNVEWTWPTFDVLSHMHCLNLKHFQLQWDIGNPIFDFKTFSKFPNLLSVTLVTTDGRYVNFDAILQLPKQLKFVFLMNSLTEAEELIIEQRNAMCLKQS
jgi:hypothetical protein